MAGSRERVLLVIFCVVLFMYAGGVGTLLYREKRQQLQKQILQYREQTGKMQAAGAEDIISLEEQISWFSEQLKQAERRFFAAGETDLYRFGLSLREQITRHGLEVKSYRSISESDLLEYTLNGSSLSLFRLLSMLSEGEKLLRIEQLSVKDRGRGEVDVLMRIGYEKVPGEFR